VFTKTRRRFDDRRFRSKLGWWRMANREETGREDYKREEMNNQPMQRETNTRIYWTYVV
jgi:hypothetical protein